MIILKIVTIFSPLRVFLPIAASSSPRSRLRPLDYRHAAAHHQLVGPADHVRGRGVPRRPRLGADLGAPLRRTALAATAVDRRRHVGIIAIAAVAGLVLRLAFSLLYWVDKPLTHDEHEYLALAASIAAGSRIHLHPPADRNRGSISGARPATRLPGADWRRHGQRDRAPARVKIAQALVGALTIWIIATLRSTRGRTWRRRRRGLDRRRLPTTRLDLVLCAHRVAATRPSRFRRRCRCKLPSTSQPGTHRLERSGSRSLRRPPVRRRHPDAPGNAVPLPLASIWLLAPACRCGCGRVRRGRVARRRALDGTERPRARTVRPGRVGGRHHVLDRQPSALARRRRPRGQSASQARRAGVPPRPPGSHAPKSSSRSTTGTPSAYIGGIRAGGLGLLARKAFYTFVPIGPSYTLHSTRYCAASVVSYLLLAAACRSRIRRAPAASQIGRPPCCCLARRRCLVCLVFFPQERFRIPVIDPVLIVSRRRVRLDAGVADPLTDG